MTLDNRVKLLGLIILMSLLVLVMPTVQADARDDRFASLFDEVDRGVGLDLGGDQSTTASRTLEDGNLANGLALDALFDDVVELEEPTARSTSRRAEEQIDRVRSDSSNIHVQGNHISLLGDGYVSLYVDVTDRSGISLDDTGYHLIVVPDHDGSLLESKDLAQIRSAAYDPQRKAWYMARKLDLDSIEDVTFYLLCLDCQEGERVGDFGPYTQRRLVAERQFSVQQVRLPAGPGKYQRRPLEFQEPNRQVGIYQIDHEVSLFSHQIVITLTSQLRNRSTNRLQLGDILYELETRGDLLDYNHISESSLKCGSSYAQRAGRNYKLPPDSTCFLTTRLAIDTDLAGEEVEITVSLRGRSDAINPRRDSERVEIDIPTYTPREYQQPTRDSVRNTNRSSETKKQYDQSVSLPPTQLQPPAQTVLPPRCDPRYRDWWRAKYPDLIDLPSPLPYPCPPGQAPSPPEPDPGEWCDPRPNPRKQKYPDLVDLPCPIDDPGATKVVPF